MNETLGRWILVGLFVTPVLWKCYLQVRHPEAYRQAKEAEAARKRFAVKTGLTLLNWFK